MPSRRKIREAVVQFLYCADIEGDGSPASLREPFWDFVTESDQKALAVATWKTIQHLNLGREQRLDEFNERLPLALATLKARPELEPASINLQRIAELEHRWTITVRKLAAIPRDDPEKSTPELRKGFEELFMVNRELRSSRRQFRETFEDLPELRSTLEPIAGSIQRLERISERLSMVESPEDFPNEADLKKLRDSRSELQQLREHADRIVDAVLAEKAAIDTALENVVENFAPERIDPIDRAILRLGTWEILHNPDAPKPVAINEAIELAKKFGTTDSGKFVNGILDRIG